MPSTVLGSHEGFCNVTYSPLLYAPLFSLAAVEVCFILSEGIIVIVSAQGPIYKETKSFEFRTKFMPHLIYLRIIVAVLELLAIIASFVGIFHPSAVSDIKRCEPLRPRLYFAQATVVFQLFCYILFLLKCLCIYTDPLSLNLSKDEDSTDFDIKQSTKQKYEQKLHTLFSCLGMKKHKLRGVALEDIAHGLHAIFNETNVVISDVIAGLSLLREDQLLKIHAHNDEAAVLAESFKLVSV